MIVKKYRNGNFTIKHEAFLDGPAPETVPELIEAVSQADALERIENIDIVSFGNDRSAYEINGDIGAGYGCGLRYYYVTDEDLERYRAGYTVRFRGPEWAPEFVMPTYWATGTGEYKGQKGIVYHLEQYGPDKFDPRSEVAERMRACGCSLLESYPAYAPEQKHWAVFVPRGTHYSLF